MLLNHAITNDVIPPNQFGFKANHSTTHAISKFSSDVNYYLHNNQIIGTVLIDLEKAFDSVWNKGLIHKMKNYNFPMGLTLLILDMIRGKNFQTWDGKQLSTTKFKITEGLQ